MQYYYYAVIISTSPYKDMARTECPQVLVCLLACFLALEPPLTLLNAATTHFQCPF